MAIPLTAVVFTQAMDPTDIVDFSLSISQGATSLEILADGENVASFTLEPRAETIAAGVEILTGGGYVTSMVSNFLIFWLNIPDPAERLSTLFDGTSNPFGFELTIVTDHSPPRRYQRTLVVRIAQK